MIRSALLRSLTAAKLPLAKNLEDFELAHTLINEGLVRDLATGTFAADQRNVVLIRWVDDSGAGQTADCPLGLSQRGPCPLAGGALVEGPFTPQRSSS